MKDTPAGARDRLASAFRLGELDRDELTALAERVDRELDARAFEANLKREVQSHLRRTGLRDDRGTGRRAR